jgi:hypothetical protein
MNTNNVTDDLKPTTKTSYFYIFLAAVIIGPFLVLGLIVLANRLLPAEDAQAFKAPLFAVWGTISGGSGLAVVVGGLLKTQGKIATQKAIAVAQSVAQDAVPDGYPGSESYSRSMDPDDDEPAVDSE